MTHMLQTVKKKAVQCRLDYCQAKSMQLSEFTSQSEFFLERFLLKQLVMVDQNIVSLFIVFDTGRYSLCTYFFVKCQVEEMSGRAKSYSITIIFKFIFVLGCPSHRHSQSDILSLRRLCCVTCFVAKTRILSWPLPQETVRNKTTNRNM